KGLSFWVVRKIEPVRVPGSSGLWSQTVPTLEARGLGGAAALALVICAGLQEPRPSAAEGLTVIPWGRVTTAFFKGGVARVSGSSDWGTLSSTSRPEAESAVLESGCTVRVGLKWSRLQPVTGGESAVAEAQLGS